jgi:pimeloyl-ACP methyl ester carboxylesterase
MRGWAEATASYGVRAVAVSTCASTPIDGRHDANASDLRRVASAVAGENAPVAYAGFSAGGLASLLAAAGDPRATGLLGLDAVDASNLASAATDLAVPSTFLAGAPHPCNAEGNMLPVARAIDGATVVTIPFATHGDFERPTDPTVDRLCGSLEPRAERERIRTAIRSLAMAWVLDVAGIVHETP